MERDPYLGRVLKAAYRLESVLGEGGFGAVYRAQQLAVGRPVAVKVIRPERTRDPAVRERLTARFRREALATSRLSHPNTVRLFDFGEDDDGTLFLVLELLEGRDLERELMFERTLSPARTAHIARQICGSLGEAHDRGMVHRDLKPSNVFLCAFNDAADFVKVMDFGIAKLALDQDVSKLTETGTTFGTPMYMAPEQACGLEPTPATDLYSLGCVIYELLAGRTVFTAPTPLALSMAHLNDPPPALALDGMPESLAERWRTLVGQLLAKQPLDRPVSARAVAVELRDLEALSRAAEGPSGAEAYEALSSRGWGALSTHDQPVLGAPPAADSTQQTRRWPRRAGWVAGALGVAALAGAAIFWSGHRSPPETEAPAVRATEVDPTAASQTMRQWLDGLAPPAPEAVAGIEQIPSAAPPQPPAPAGVGTPAASEPAAPALDEAAL
ncbi:MAG: serine/threonine protein kinase, partial [Deltaproteobacteria bacterium]|nr:serine/threonine protein kinase [Deltaproteobacteria bacterium]